MSDIQTVRISALAQNKTKSVPEAIQVKLKSWAHAVTCYGLTEVRRLRGFKDEALKGQRKGQRSIRLSKSYHAIYVITCGGGTEIPRSGAEAPDERDAIADGGAEATDTGADATARGVRIAEIIEVSKHKP